MGKLGGGISADEMEAHREAVRRGADMLDRAARHDSKVVPFVWRELLDSSRLSLACPYNCVLGQIAEFNDLSTDGFGDMGLLLGMGTEEFIRYGFAVGMPATDEMYAPLTGAWREYLDECLAG